jgi:hypothetical protein
MIRDLVCVAVGVLLSGIAFAAWEWASNRPRRHRIRGNYFDARAPFAITSIGGPVKERSDAHVDRVAHRLGRLRNRQWSEPDSGASGRR